MATSLKSHEALLTRYCNNLERSLITTKALRIRMIILWLVVAHRRKSKSSCLRYSFNQPLHLLKRHLLGKGFDFPWSFNLRPGSLERARKKSRQTLVRTQRSISGNIFRSTWDDAEFWKRPLVTPRPWQFFPLQTLIARRRRPSSGSRCSETRADAAVPCRRLCFLFCCSINCWKAHFVLADFDEANPA